MIIEPMKAITVWQPWAGLLACGAKLYETRSWATNYRGPIAIHAGAKLPPAWMVRDGLFDIMLDAMVDHGMPVDAMNVGCVVATAELVGCHFIRDAKATELMYGGDPAHGATFKAPSIKGGSDLVLITGNEFLFGDWSHGRFAWEFKNMQMLKDPVPAKGKQGLWLWEGVA